MSENYPRNISKKETIDPLTPRLHNKIKRIDPILQSYTPNEINYFHTKEGAEILKFWSTGEEITENIPRAKEAPKKRGPVLYRFTWDMPQGVAHYKPSTNEVCVGPAVLGITEESLLGVLAHEKTHVLFSELSLEEQGVVVDAVMQQSGAVNKFYQTLRFGYTIKYFGELRGITFRLALMLGGKDTKVDMRKLDNGGTIEEANVTEVVNELVAFANTALSPDDALGKDRLISEAYVLARAIVDSLDPKIIAMLKEKGMYQVDAGAELKELREDPSYKAAVASSRSTLQTYMQAIFGFGSSTIIFQPAISSIKPRTHNISS